MKYLVIAYDRIDRHFKKEIEAGSKDEAEAIAESEEIGTDAGWTECYENLFSECYVASVELVDEV